MKGRVVLFHYFLLVAELGSLVALCLCGFVWPRGTTVVHGVIWPATACLAGGVGLIGAGVLLADYQRDEMPRTSWTCSLRRLGIVCGILLSILGGISALKAFPELTRFPAVTDEESRWVKMEAVSVEFDVNGGRCDDARRITRVGEVYGSTMNVFPSEDERRMRLHNAQVDLREGWIIGDGSGAAEEDRFINYFSSNAVPNKILGGKWTYVVDMLELDGQFAGWFVGQTCPTNWEAYSQLSLAALRQTLKAGEKQFLLLESSKWGEKCNMLDRAYIHLKSGQNLKIKFRVSLFAGTGVNESNYHYVMPGETIECSLPVPKRDGYAFEGWYDGDRRITEKSKVEKRETHTLKARWRKL